MRTITGVGLAALLIAITGGLSWQRIRASQNAASAAAAREERAAAIPALPPPETFTEVFMPCAHCHEIGQGARPMTGPPLTGLIGRKAASYPHYPYSQAMRQSGIVWNEATLSRFIADPQAMVPGSRMIFAVQSPETIKAIVAFIKSIKGGDSADGTGLRAKASAAEAQSSAARSLSPAALAIGGPFTLVDTRGHKVTQADLLGKPSALFFGYTYCPDVCPTTLADLSRLMKKMGPDADKLNVVFVTIDPARDTAHQLADYLSSFDPRIRGFTGTAAQVAGIAKAYHVYYKRVPNPNGGYSMDHTASVYLMDARGNFTGTLSAEEDDATSLAKLERLVRSGT